MDVLLLIDSDISGKELPFQIQIRKGKSLIIHFQSLFGGHMLSGNQHLLVDIETVQLLGGHFHLVSIIVIKY